MKVSITAMMLALVLSSGPVWAQPVVPVPGAGTIPVPLPLPFPPAATLPPAGFVPTAVNVQLAGAATPRFVLARVRAAIDARTQRHPGTLLDVHGITVPGMLAPGSTLDALAGVTIGGRGTFSDVSGQTNVHVTIADLPRFEPNLLYYSDDPEYIGATNDGVLFAATLGSDDAARLFLYHVAAGAARRVALVVQADVPTQVEMIGAAVGPSPQFAYVGQQATARFLLEHALGEGQLLDIAPGAPLDLPLGMLNPGDLIEAIEDLRVVAGGPAIIAVITTAAVSSDLTFVGTPELPTDSHERRGIFALTGIVPVDLSLSASASATPEPVSVGVTPFENQRPGGRPLGGDYGVTRRVALHLTNPTAQTQSFYLWERTLGGGGATATLLFDGENGATLVPCVNDSTTPRLVRAFELGPGVNRDIAATYMTDGASTYPIEFGLGLTPPLAVPPGACNGPAAPAIPAPSTSL